MAAALAGGAASGCTEPQYLYPGTAIEVMALDEVSERATMSLDLPIRLEEEDEGIERAELIAELGVEVPYVVRGDLAISLEWTIKNLLDTPSEATLMVNGGNEWFFYDPDVFIVEGFNPGMPAISKPPIGLSNDEIMCVIAWLQSMGGEADVTLDTLHSYNSDTGDQ